MKESDLFIIFAQKCTEYGIRAALHAEGKFLPNQIQWQWRGSHLNFSRSTTKIFYTTFLYLLRFVN